MISPMPSSSKEPAACSLAGDAKRELRTHLKVERAAMSPAVRTALDERIAHHVSRTSAFQQAQVVCTYLSFGDEIDTRALIQEAWQAHKLVALPRCEGRSELAWYVVDTLVGLVRSPFGMEEPDPRACACFDLNELEHLDSSALVIVPGLAFDKRGYRLGYGGGFYDRFLAHFKGMSMGLCYDAHRYESLAQLGVIDAHDMPVDFVATESGIYGT